MSRRPFRRTARHWNGRWRSAAAAAAAVLTLLVTSLTAAGEPVAASTRVPTATAAAVAARTWTSAAKATAPAGVPGTWRPVFADEFGGTTLDTRKWSTGWFGAGVTQPVNDVEPVCYDPRQVQLRGDGALTLALVGRSQWCGGRQRPWSSGLVTTNGRFSYAYGGSEARIHLPADAAGRLVDWPAF